MIGPFKYFIESYFRLVSNKFNRDCWLKLFFTYLFVTYQNEFDVHKQWITKTLLNMIQLLISFNNVYHKMYSTFFGQILKPKGSLVAVRVARINSSIYHNQMLSSQNTWANFGHSESRYFAKAARILIIDVRYSV